MFQDSRVSINSQCLEGNSDTSLLELSCNKELHHASKGDTGPSEEFVKWGSSVRMR